MGRFAPDGRHYVSSDWGRDFGATSLAGRVTETGLQNLGRIPMPHGVHHLDIAAKRKF